MIIYGICLVLGLMFTLLSAFMGHLFGGHGEVGTGGHADAGLHSDGTPGFTFFSPMILATFLTAFGGLGLIFSEIAATQSPWFSAPLSAAGAFFLALLVLWMMNTIFRRTQSSSEAKVATLVGLNAAIVTPIPANGVGEISYIQAGSRYTAPAREESGQAVAGGKTVRITRIVGTQFFVSVA